ncbi:HPr-rel-A system PqqD family peptide chaperone [Geoalkalibacter halelectricus]|uniref:HPr-rel-A system PqqD family peptide chaperone n=1 Tax=Geoalkalibacter halelectricus TaxID=2847045 RepID=A0ABY5ZHX8_9BACT|nr:HPr-rel-A system PqqD family peptide chaperone [Geoalkalibacter halelectricus]MDO3379681.1 HPr-rel-A system PqqD family peptide chaperone [Geoalkalibacter halelectricus]UWZ78504.1 HPr-rel-A system PqqD family peptide chaperone [Geoalkalibacter halelectricus]
MEESIRRWKITDPSCLLWRYWDDEHIVFNTLSGDAHLLNPPAAAALKILQKSCLSVDELTLEVARVSSLEANPELRAHLQQFVLQLARMGLALPADDPR